MMNAASDHHPQLRSGLMAESDDQGDQTETPAKKAPVKKAAKKAPASSPPAKKAAPALKPALEAAPALAALTAGNPARDTAAQAKSTVQAAADVGLPPHHGAAGRVGIPLSIGFAAVGLLTLVLRRFWRD
jgi:hypothetical protein